MGNFHCFLFDVDGTLADTHELISTSLVNAIEKTKGTTIKKQEIEKIAHQSPKKILSHFGINDLNTYWRYYDRNIHLALPFFSETKEILTEIKSKNIQLGIVSSLPPSKISRILDHLSILDLFDVLIGWQLTVPRKPNPHPILSALKKIGIPNSKSIYIGDAEEDIIAAKRAEVYSVCVGWSKRKGIEKFKSDVIIHHLSELLSF